MRQAPQCFGARVVAPGLCAEWVGPSSMPAVCSDLQSQPCEGIEHPLVFVKDFHFRISPDHGLEQPGRTAPFAGFWIDWNRDAALPHQLKHGGTFEHAAVIDLEAKLVIEPASHLCCNGRGDRLCSSVERHI